MGPRPGPLGLVLSAFAVALFSSLVAAQQARKPLRSLLQTPSNSSSNPSECCSKLAAIGFSSNLPVVILDSSGQEIPHDVDTKITLCTCSNGASFEDYFGPAEAAGRGTSSANFTKKSYKIKTEDASGKSQDVAFLGMPADNDWILYGPELDKTLGMRNYLTYNLARASGHYATRTVYCEVFLVDDGQALHLQHYNGIYIAEEKVKRGKNRVDIAKLTPPDLSGGYIFLYDNDNIVAGDVTFGALPGWQHPFLIKEPKNFPAGDNGAWILKHLKSFEDALNAPDWLDRQGSASYRSFIDPPEFVDFFLLVELTKSPDGYRGSTYMYKDKGKPFNLGPAWDYNEAFGMCCGYPIDGWQRGGQSGPGVSGGSAISPEGWRFNICDTPERCLVDPGDGTSRWFRRMWQDSRFKSSAAARWAELRNGVWSDAALKDMINSVTENIAGGALRNYQKYTEVLEANPGDDLNAVWRGHIAKLENWLLAHVTWIDGAIEAAGGINTQSTTQAG